MLKVKTKVENFEVYMKTASPHWDGEGSGSIFSEQKGSLPSSMEYNRLLLYLFIRRTLHTSSRTFTTIVTQSQIEIRLQLHRIQWNLWRRLIGIYSP